MHLGITLGNTPAIIEAGEICGWCDDLDPKGYVVWRSSPWGLTPNRPSFSAVRQDLVRSRLCRIASVYLARALESGMSN